MFSEMIAAIRDNRLPNPELLQKRFEFALTKKLGIIKLPPAFWMRDPKINPRADHLFWAAVLLKDRRRIDMALSIIAVELAENSSPGSVGCGQEVEEKARELVGMLLEQFSDPEVRQHLVQGLDGIVAAEWLPGGAEKTR